MRLGPFVIMLRREARDRRIYARAARERVWNIKRELITPFCDGEACKRRHARLAAMAELAHSATSIVLRQTEV